MPHLAIAEKSFQAAHALFEHEVTDAVAVTRLFYPKMRPEGDRRPVGLERMLRTCFVQRWYALSDPAVEDALYDSTSMRRFAGIDLAHEPAPDETTA